MQRDKAVGESSQLASPHTRKLGALWLSGAQYLGESPVWLGETKQFTEQILIIFICPVSDTVLGARIKEISELQSKGQQGLMVLGRIRTGI